MVAHLVSVVARGSRFPFESLSTRLRSRRGDRWMKVRSEVRGERVRLREAEVMDEPMQTWW